jgi:hypothetical protein
MSFGFPRLVMLDDVGRVCAGLLVPKPGAAWLHGAHSPHEKSRADVGSAEKLQIGYFL